MRRRERERCGNKRVTAGTVGAALRAGDLDFVRDWICRGTQPDWSWICETMRGGHFEVAEFVMQSGVSRNIFTMAAMAEAAHLKRRLRRFAQDARRTANMEPGCVAVTPLHVACAAYPARVRPNGTKSQLNVAEQLLAHGADVNARARYRDLEDATPLTCACWSSGNVVLVDTLLNHGAIASERDLFAALGHYQRHASPAFDIAESLLAAGIAVDGRVSGEFTLLQTFAHQAAHRTVAWLIKRGADVNRRGPGGRTAAHFAAERNTGPRTLELLIAHGADLTCRDDDGNRPIDVARRNGKLGLVELLKRSR
ncbi:MAG: ankyrin repeat domain-containing protein [Planctomycetaceae bacterium]